MVNAIFFILYKLKGFSLDDVLNMYMSQFNVILDKLTKQIKSENKKSKGKKGKK